MNILDLKANGVVEEIDEDKIRKNNAKHIFTVDDTFTVNVNPQLMDIIQNKVSLSKSSPKEMEDDLDRVVRGWLGGN